MQPTNFRRDTNGLFGVQLDAKSPDLYAQFGYQQSLCFDDYLNAYQRNPAATAAVDKLLRKCWQEAPRIKELREGEDEANDDKPTAWEKTVSDLFRSLKLWGKVREADKRRMIGRFSAVILRIADGREVSQPAGSGKLADIIPVYEGQLRVTAWDSDLNSQNFGLPAMYQYRTRLPEGNHVDTQGQPEKWKDVHPSRVVIHCDGEVRDMFDSVPLLRSGFNRLADLEKISGSSGESYRKNASRTLVFKFDRESDVADAVKSAYGNDAKVSDVLDEKARDMNTSIDASAVMQGGDLNTLQVTVADPTGPWTVAANEFAASVGIPFTILFGQQTGRLASAEDQKDWAMTAMSRQSGDIDPFIDRLLHRLMQIGAIPAMELFCIEWCDLLAPSDSEKFDNAAKLATINKTMVEAGMAQPFDENEIRTAAGYEPLEESDIDGMKEDNAPAEEDMPDGEPV